MALDQTSFHVLSLDYHFVFAQVGKDYPKYIASFCLVEFFDFFLSQDLSAEDVIEHMRELRGPRAVQSVKQVRDKAVAASFSPSRITPFWAKQPFRAFWFFLHAKEPFPVD